MIPALSEHRPLRLVTVTGMYVAQGIQLGLMMVAIPAYMAGKGLSPAAVGGFIGAIMLPWTLKIASGPLMDRFSFLPMGRRRPWVLAGLTAAALGYVGMGLVNDPLNNLALFTAMAVVVSLCTAVMDVAIDGMAIDILPLDEQPLANGFMWGGKVLGSAATTAGAAWFLSDYGMQATCFTAALFTFAFTLFPGLLRERPGERLLPWTSGHPAPENLLVQLDGWKPILQSLFQVVLLPASLAAGVVAFVNGMTYGLFDAVMPVLTVQQLGWEDTAYSNLSAVSGLIGGVLGMLFGGRLVDLLGRLRTMGVLLAVLALASVLMALGSSLWPNPLTIQVYVALVYVVRTFLFIAVFAACMALCWRPVAATQFALLMAIGNLGISAGAAILGPLAAVFTYPQIWFVFAGISMVGAVLLRLIHFERHQERLAALDRARAG